MPLLGTDDGDDDEDDTLVLSAAPPFALPFPNPPSLPLNEAEIPEALSQETELRTSVETAAKGERRKPRKLLFVVAAASSSPSSFLLLLGTARSVAEASTRRGTLFSMSDTIVQGRARRQMTWALLPREADAERGAEEEEVEEVEEVESREEEEEEGFNIAALKERGLFRAWSNASPTLRSKCEPSLPSEVPFRRLPEGARRLRRAIFGSMRERDSESPSPRDEEKWGEKKTPLTFLSSLGRRASSVFVRASFSLSLSLFHPSRP